MSIMELGSTGMYGAAPWDRREKGIVCHDLGVESTRACNRVSQSVEVSLCTIISIKVAHKVSDE